jgi:hypothetical protein
MEREPSGENLKMMIAIVEHCRGKTIRHLKAGTTILELSEKYQLMANEHDRVIHGENDPCKKRYLIA